MKAEKIRDELRNGTSEYLERKRKIILLSVIGLADFGIISLFQSGIIRKLPDLPGKFIDSNKVSSSEDAYIMGVPDGPVSATVYGLNIVFATAQGTKDTERHPIFDVLLGASVFGNAAGAAYYLYTMITRQKVACAYCGLGAFLNFAMLPFAIPDAIKGFKEIFSRKGTKQPELKFQPKVKEQEEILLV